MVAALSVPGMAAVYVGLEGDLLYRTSMASGYAGIALLSVTLGLSQAAWDVYLIYPPGVTWPPGVAWNGDAPPKPAYWMHQLPERYGVGDAPRLDPEKFHTEVKRELQIFG